MKFEVDGDLVFDLNDTRKKVICNDIDIDGIDNDLKRRAKYIIEHKYQQCFRRLKDEWDPKLKDLGVESIPLDEDQYAELVFSQQSYKDRKDREETV